MALPNCLTSFLSWPTIKWRVLRILSSPWFELIVQVLILGLGLTLWDIFSDIFIGISVYRLETDKSTTAEQIENESKGCAFVHEEFRMRMIQLGTLFCVCLPGILMAIELLHRPGSDWIWFQHWNQEKLLQLSWWQKALIFPPLAFAMILMGIVIPVWRYFRLARACLREIQGKSKVQLEDSRKPLEAKLMEVAGEGLPQIMVKAGFLMLLMRFEGLKQVRQEVYKCQVSNASVYEEVNVLCNHVFPSIKLSCTQVVLFILMGISLFSSMLTMANSKRIRLFELSLLNPGLKKVPLAYSILQALLALTSILTKASFFVWMFMYSLHRDQEFFIVFFSLMLYILNWISYWMAFGTTNKARFIWTDSFKSLIIPMDYIDKSAGKTKAFLIWHFLSHHGLFLLILCGQDLTLYTRHINHWIDLLYRSSWFGADTTLVCIGINQVVAFFFWHYGLQPLYSHGFCYPSKSKEEDRTSSYPPDWSNLGQAQDLPEPSDLASKGHFYDSLRLDGPSTSCFACGFHVSDWSSDPLNNENTHHDNCPITDQVKGASAKKGRKEFEEESKWLIGAVPVLSTALVLLTIVSLWILAAYSQIIILDLKHFWNESELPQNYITYWEDVYDNFQVAGPIPFVVKILLPATILISAFGLYSILLLVGNGSALSEKKAIFWIIPINRKTRKQWSYQMAPLLVFVLVWHAQMNVLTNSTDIWAIPESYQAHSIDREALINADFQSCDVRVMREYNATMSIDPLKGCFDYQIFMDPTHKPPQKDKRFHNIARSICAAVLITMEDQMGIPNRVKRSPSFNLNDILDRSNIKLPDQFKDILADPKVKDLIKQNIGNNLASNAFEKILDCSSRDQDCKDLSAALINAVRNGKVDSPTLDLLQKYGLGRFLGTISDCLKPSSLCKTILDAANVDLDQLLESVKKPLIQQKVQELLACNPTSAWCLQLSKKLVDELDQTVHIGDLKLPKAVLESKIETKVRKAAIDFAVSELLLHCPEDDSDRDCLALQTRTANDILNYGTLRRSTLKELQRLVSPEQVMERFMWCIHDPDCSRLLDLHIQDPLNSNHLDFDCDIGNNFAFCKAIEMLPNIGVLFGFKFGENGTNSHGFGYRLKGCRNVNLEKVDAFFSGTLGAQRFTKMDLFNKRNGMEEFCEKNEDISYLCKNNHTTLDYCTYSILGLRPNATTAPRFQICRKDNIEASAVSQFDLRFWIRVTSIICYILVSLDIFIVAYLDITKLKRKTRAALDGLLFNRIH